MRSILHGRLWPSLSAPWTFVSGKHALTTHVAVLFLLVAALFPYWIARTNGDKSDSDALQNLTAAFNVAKSGIFSANDPASQVAPTRRREPLPPFVVAGFIKILETFKGPLEYQALLSGPGARWIKLSNLLWCVIISVGVYAAVNTLTGSLPFAAAATIVAADYIEVNRLMTEPPAQAFLLLLSLFSVMMIRSPRPAYFCAAGLSLGALILTKAAFLYIGIALFLALAAWLAWDKLHGRLQRSSIIGFFIFVLSTAALTVPWSARNYYHFGSPGLAERGGAVLYIRALENEMTSLEYAGAFYVWAPYGWAKVGLGKTLGFSKADLNKGGSLQRLNRLIPGDRENVLAGRPDLTTSYYNQAKAERRRLATDFAKQGQADPAGAAEDLLMRRSIEKIQARPLMHLSMVPLLIWKGDALTFLLSALAVVLMLKGRPRVDAFIYAVPSLAMVAFLALATHYIARYSDPVIPIVVVLVAVLIHRVSVVASRLVVRIWQNNRLALLPSHGGALN
jgi:hypothetical protein